MVKIENDYILHLEDNIGDQVIFQEIFEENKLHNVELVQAENGEKGYSILSDFGKPPLIIILDINMPVMNGLEFLMKIKSDSDLKRIPCIMLTSSASKRDVLASYEHSANAYLIKGLQLEDYRKNMTALINFWLGVNVAPIMVF